MVKNPAPAPAPAGFAIKIRQNPAAAGFGKSKSGTILVWMIDRLSSASHWLETTRCCMMTIELSASFCFSRASASSSPSLMASSSGSLPGLSQQLPVMFEYFEVNNLLSYKTLFYFILYISHDVILDVEENNQTNVTTTYLS